MIHGRPTMFQVLLIGIAAFFIAIVAMVTLGGGA
jgi:hypothetical protein